MITAELNQWSMKAKRSKKIFKHLEHQQNNPVLIEFRPAVVLDVETEWRDSQHLPGGK
jgi:hypothetical protein